MHLGNLKSTQEARVALGYRLEQLLRFSRALQTSHVHPKLDIRTLSMNQFLIEEIVLVMVNNRILELYVSTNKGTWSNLSF